jgi:hypothetical protein
VKLVAVGLAPGIAVGYLLGGRLSQLSDLKPRYAPSASIGLLLQLVKQHLAGPADRLEFLGDVIAIPPPVGRAISVGDIFTYGGMTVVIAASMRRRVRSPQPASLAEVSGVQV